MLDYTGFTAFVNERSGFDPLTVEQVEAIINGQREMRKQREIQG